MKKKILIADDDVSIQFLLNQTLTVAGYKVIQATDGEEAIRLAHAEKPHLLLLDIYMPKIHGYQVCKKIRADHDPKIAQMKIVAISVKNYRTDIKTAKQLGIDRYVVKPFAIQGLLDTIEDVLKSSN